MLFRMGELSRNYPQKLRSDGVEDRFRVEDRFPSSRK